MINGWYPSYMIKVHFLPTDSHSHTHALTHKIITCVTLMVAFQLSVGIFIKGTPFTNRNSYWYIFPISQQLLQRWLYHGIHTTDAKIVTFSCKKKLVFVIKFTNVFYFFFVFHSDQSEEMLQTSAADDNSALGSPEQPYTPLIDTISNSSEVSLC